MPYLLPWTTTKIAGLRVLIEPTNSKLLDTNLLEIEIVIFWYSRHFVICETDIILLAALILLCTALHKIWCNLCFQYAGDQEDKNWLHENHHMPATGGKAYLLVVDDILSLAETEEYRYKRSIY